MTIRSEGKKRRLIYRGNQAIFHGLLYIIIGCVAFIWGLRPIFGFADITWAWCFKGYGIMLGMVIIGAMILTAWSRIQEGDGE